MPKQRILIIKLGALGDFVYSIGPMQAIKKNHPDSELTLMTRPAFEQLGQRTNIFDEILIDEEPKKWQLLKMINLRNILRSKDFTRIYDLQTSDRTGFYYKMLGPGLRPEWSGIVKGCSHYHHYKRPTLIHTQVRQRAQLRIAGIETVPEPDLSFMNECLKNFDLPKNYALIIPGSSAKMKIKRWPATSYAELSTVLAQRNITPILIGTNEDMDAINIITRMCPRALNLVGKTSIFQIASLGRSAQFCIGNDTGPMHIIALTKCPTTAIFSTASFPEKAAPKGKHIKLLIREKLEDLSLEEVISSIDRI
jgi:ADP-heptose:LPS heptosyltransferase